MDPPPPPGSSSIFRFSPNSSSSSTSNFPILAVAVIGILATALLLLSYYIFVIKCCLNWHRIDLLRRFSTSSRRRPSDSPVPVYFPSATPRGLDESLIRLIPVIRFRKEATENRKQGSGDGEETEYLECAVCLSDFKEGEKLRVIPNCCHAFHIDCIDVWLQSNANCPLCRSSISSNNLSSIDRIPVNPTRPSLDPNPGRFDVVIEIQDNNLDEPRLVTPEERVQRSISPPLKPEQGKPKPKPKPKRGDRFPHLSSMDDECVNIRNKDDLFHGVPPMRRSISMDLSRHRQLCSEGECSSGNEGEMQGNDILEQSRMQGKTGVSSSSNEGESSSSSSNRGMRRSFFSFGSGRSGSRNASLPL